MKKEERSVKKTVTMPKWLNDLALEHKINFSGTLQKALIIELAEFIDKKS
jgi:antitoxin HicB